MDKRTPTPPNKSKRLRFESELQGGLVEDATSGQLVPKSAPDKPKSRLRFAEDTPTESTLIQDSPNSRLRFEDEDTRENAQPTVTADTPKQSQPKVRFAEKSTPHGLPLPPHKAKERLHFGDADGLPPTETAAETSGQVGSKLKQRSDFQQGDKNSALSETMYTDDSSSTFIQDDEDSTRHQDSDTLTPKGKSKPTHADTPPKPKPKVKQAAQSTQDNIHVQKAQNKVDKIESKLDKAREVLTEQKPYKPPSLVKQFGGFVAWRYAHRKIHQKIHEVEHENVGTGSAHKTELAIEGWVLFICMSTHFARDFEDEFVKIVVSEKYKRIQLAQRENKRKLDTAKKREQELDLMFARIYEDNALGKLPDSQYQKLLHKYTEEHDILREQIKFLEVVVKEELANEMEVSDFLKVVQKYTRVNQLTPAILREFIHHIVVHHREVIGKETVQKVEVHFNFIGEVDLPDVEQRQKLLAAFGKKRKEQTA